MFWVLREGKKTGIQNLTDNSNNVTMKTWILEVPKEYLTEMKENLKWSSLPKTLFLDQHHFGPSPETCWILTRPSDGSNGDCGLRNTDLVSFHYFIDEKTMKEPNSHVWFLIETRIKSKWENIKTTTNSFYPLSCKLTTTCINHFWGYKLEL